jgi:hypothetical protein
MDGEAFIRELCIALEHRWKPGRLFVILTAYFDESGTHRGSPVTIMAGIMATANQWDRFRRELDKIKTKYGFRVFHSKEFKARSGEFRGWPHVKWLSLINDMAELTRRSFMRSVVFELENQDYEENYRGGETPRRLRLDSKYGLAFRYCLTALTAEAIRRLGNHKRFPETRLRVVVEDGHPNAGDVQRIFTELRRELEDFGVSLLDSITFAAKRDADPLMVADFLAHTTFMIQRPEDRSDVFHMGFEPGGLAALRAALIEQLNARHTSRGASAAGGRGVALKEQLC